MLKMSGGVARGTRHITFLSQKNKCFAINLSIWARAFKNPNYPNDITLKWADEIGDDILKNKIFGYALKSFNETKRQGDTAEFVYNADLGDSNMQVKISKTKPVSIPENVKCASLTKTQMHYLHIAVLSVARLMGPEAGAYTRDLKVCKGGQVRHINVVDNYDSEIDGPDSAADALSKIKQVLRQKLYENRGTGLFLFYRIRADDMQVGFRFTYETPTTIQINMANFGLKKVSTHDIFNRPVTLGELCVFGTAIKDMAGFNPPFNFVCWRIADNYTSHVIACVDTKSSRQRAL
jgi:hypothetical protein